MIMGMACVIYFIHSFISRHTSETFVFLLSSTLPFFREFLLPLFQSCACWSSQFKFSIPLVLVGIRPGLAQTILRPQWLKQGGMYFKLAVSISPSRFCLGFTERYHAFRIMLLGLCKQGIGRRTLPFMSQDLRLMHEKKKVECQS